MTLKGTVCKKSIFTRPHVVPKLYAILYSNKHTKKVSDKIIFCRIDERQWDIISLLMKTVEYTFKLSSFFHVSVVVKPPVC